jgi:hypothetical protein
MAKANIHRRSTLEEVYPPDAFASDAAQNGRVPNTVLSGVRILSAPDAAGDFDFERATQQIGEAASASFLAPHRREDRTLDAGRDSPTTVSADPDPRAGYEGFLADIVAAARRFGFEPEDSPGRDEPRLRGLRQ